LITDFDTYFAQFPALDRERDFEDFWEQSIRSLRDIPIDANIEQEKKKTKPGFIGYSVSFKGLNRSRTSGKLLIPEKAQKPRLILVFNDYFRKNQYLNYVLDHSVGYFFLTLKGHETLNFDQTEEERKTPGYMVDNILDIKSYYVREVFLDAYRSIDMLRLRNFIDMSSIGIIGKGFGGAMALFSASRSGRVELMDSQTRVGAAPNIHTTMVTASEVYGSAAVGVIMTGMGSDGANGMEKIKNGEGATVAQDEETCLVFGMPKVAIEKGCVDWVVALEMIPDKVMELL
jgi:hypothetical protein